MSDRTRKNSIVLVVISAIVFGMVGAAFAADCKWTPWSESRPWLSGKRYEAVVPDTLDLCHRAELALNAITGMVDPEPPANGEIWTGGGFNFNPPYMLHSTGQNGVMQPKVAEPVAGLRVMTGSALDLDMEKAMVDWLVRGISKDDGLLYSLVKPERPWYAFDCEGIARALGSPGTESVGEPIPGGDTDYAWIYGQIRMVKFMMAYYQYGRDPAWKARIDRMIEGIDKKMARHNVDPATGKKYAYMPSGGGINAAYGSCMPRSGWKEGAHEPAGEGESANEESVFMDIGTYPGALAQWYQMTGNRRALELAHEFANFVTMKKFWGTDKDPIGRERGAELGHWEGHFFGRMEALKGLLEYAMVTNDPALKEFVRNGYEWARNSNLWPSFSKPVAPIPAIGFFDAHCGCTTPRMIALAIRLSDAGLGDYWEDVDRYVRNNMMEIQTVDPALLRKLIEGKKAPVIRPGIDNVDRVLERNIGGFCATGSPAEIMCPPIAFDITCCLCHGAWGLYYAWEGIVRCDKGVARVNLLLNRAAPWLDVDSYLPYEGRVVVKNKTAKTLFLRIPVWVDKKAVKCRRNNKSVDLVWFENYLMITGLSPKDTITAEFPMVERIERYQGYTIQFKGNTVVDISPRKQKEGLTTSGKIGQGEYPIYLRDYMKSDKAPMKKITRYVSPLLIKW